jgi:hypothetical protein
MSAAAGLQAEMLKGWGRVKFRPLPEHAPAWLANPDNNTRPPGNALSQGASRAAYTPAATVNRVSLGAAARIVPRSEAPSGVARHAR